jgi:hypothetical protein
LIMSSISKIPGKYPDAVDYSATKTLAQYQTQVRLRGKQVMAAMIAQFPNIEIFVPHGPYWSEPKFNQQFLPNPTYSDGQLAGSFFAGIVEAVVDAKAAGNSPKAIDGGEFYKPRTVQEFDDLYQFRKNYMPSADNNSAQIPSSLRPSWTANVSAACAVSNLTDEAPQNATIMRSTMEYATRRCDDIVWFYSQGMDWYTSGSVDAILDEYYNGFGPAAKQVRAYFDYWEQVSLKKDSAFKKKYGMGPSLTRAGESIYTEQTFIKGNELLASARIAAAKSPEDLKRVEYLEVWLKHAELAMNTLTAYRKYESNPALLPKMQKIY